VALLETDTDEGLDDAGDDDADGVDGLLDDDDGAAGELLDGVCDGEELTDELKGTVEVLLPVKV